MTDIGAWQDTVGKAWAQSWEQTDRSLSGLTTTFLDVIGELPGREVLDIGCGAGELSLALERRRQDARIIGVDVSADLVAAAQARAAGHSSVSFELGDAVTWSHSGFAPDLLVSRHGVMFFDDPDGAFAHLRSISAEGARLAFTCFRPRAENSWAEGLAALLPGAGLNSDPELPGPFAFADPSRVTRILSGAGWAGIRIEPIDFAYIAGHGVDPVKEARSFFGRIGPAAPVLRDLAGEARERVEARLLHWIGQNRRGNMVAFSGAAWQVTARRD